MSPSSSLNRRDAVEGFAITMPPSFLRASAGMVRLHCIILIRMVSVPAKPLGLALNLISLGSMPGEILESRMVLLVDDHDLTLRTISILLRNSGFDVRTALTGRAALHFLHIFRPDAVVLDLALPDISGLDVLNWLRGDPFLADTPVLIFSGDHDSLAAEPDIKSEASLLKGSASWQTLIERVIQLTEAGCTVQ